MTTKDGGRVFLVEGDSSVGEQGLALAKDPTLDLDYDEASQGFRMLEKIAK